MVALAVGGCAAGASVATQQDLLPLSGELARTREVAQRAKTDIDSLAAQVERRGREQAAERERQTATLVERLDGLAATLGTLGQRADELAARVGALDRQLRAATAGAAAPAPPAPSAPAVVVPPPEAPTAVPARPTTGPLQPQDVYQAAYIDFSKGSYWLAIAGFREFLRRYPDHELAGNAQYWLGEAYMSLAHGYATASQADRASEMLTQAVQEFGKVLANYPRAEKVPTALYKEALALIELKQPQVAQVRLQYLVDNFPQAEETPLAKEQLAALNK